VCVQTKKTTEVGALVVFIGDHVESLVLLARGKIKSPTRGFSTHLFKLKTVFAQAFAA
jgi:hypothetical protein